MSCSFTSFSTFCFLVSVTISEPYSFNTNKVENQPKDTLKRSPQLFYCRNVVQKWRLQCWKPDLSFVCHHLHHISLHSPSTSHLVSVLTYTLLPFLFFSLPPITPHPFPMSILYSANSSTFHQQPVGQWHWRPSLLTWTLTDLVQTTLF